MKNKNYDLTKLLGKIHENKWVALSPDYKKIVGSSAILANLQKSVGKKDAVYMFVPPFGVRFAF